MELDNKFSISELLSQKEIANSACELPFLVGINKDGENIVLDLTAMPHLFICGVTGSGKTSLLQTNLALIAVNKKPDEVKFIIYDSKFSDYKIFNSISHLLVPVESDYRRASGAIQWVLIEILKRYRIFAEHGVKDIASYNRNNIDKLYRIVFVIDDISELLLLGDYEEIISTLQRILSNGRQVGVHCIIVTSSPSNKLIRNGLINSFPSRICFSLSSAAESKSVLGISKATSLSFPGGLIFKGINTQCVLTAPDISEEDIIASMKGNAGISTADNCLSNTQNEYGDFIRHACRNDYSSSHDEMVKPIIDDKEDNHGYDEMIPDAVNAILESKQCSVSMLQRRIKLGYSRAVRIVDQLEALGVVGPYEGAKPRAVLVCRDEWERIAAERHIQIH